jgi:hypothetical protein
MMFGGSISFGAASLEDFSFLSEELVFHSVDTAKQTASGRTWHGQFDTSSHKATYPPFYFLIFLSNVNLVNLLLFLFCFVTLFDF